jgi:hypothetical protein
MTGLLCKDCGRIHPDTAKKCRPCSNVELLSRCCTSDFRVAEYFAVLRRCGLWPSIDPFTTFALLDVASRFQRAQIDHRHQCGARETCPLRRELELLSGRVQQILEDMEEIVIERKEME